MNSFAFLERLNNLVDKIVFYYLFLFCFLLLYSFSCETLTTLSHFKIRYVFNFYSWFSKSGVIFYSYSGVPTLLTYCYFQIPVNISFLYKGKQRCPQTWGRFKTQKEVIAKFKTERATKAGKRKLVSLLLLVDSHLPEKSGASFLLITTLHLLHLQYTIYKRHEKEEFIKRHMCF